MSKNRLWLLAHQDDEVLGLHLNFPSVRNFVVYLTDGVRVGAKYDPSFRVEEARNAWSKIDRNAELIFFGTDHSIKDGDLLGQLSDSHLAGLLSICRSRKVSEIVTLQLEGGHQDHDVTSLFAEELARRLSLEVVFVPAYRALHAKHSSYAVMSSIAKSLEMSPRNAVTRLHDTKKAFKVMRIYRSQLPTWIGLGPFVLLKYLIGKPSFLKLTNTNSPAQEFPTKLLYANRKKSEALDYGEIRKKMSNW